MQEEENLWSALLQEVQMNSSKGLPSSKNLLVLGDRLSGKTTLVAKLQGVEEPKKGSGLEYGYMEIRDDSFENATNLSVHVLDGDPKHVNLLKYALSAESVPNTQVLICASMESPWSILPQIKKWADVLEEHLDSLPISIEDRTAQKKHHAERWRQYSEFVDFFDFSPSGDLTESMYKKDLQDRASCTDTLSRNLGCDILVAITKTDSMVSLETDFNYNDEKFDFIQQAVRKFCLEIGASLFYVSVKENKNCDLLYKYLTHRIYDFSFNTPALVVERDALFIPAGWDSTTKISILYDNIRTFYPDQPYNDVIKSPKLSKKYEPRIEIVAEGEQDFLSRMYQYLGDPAQDRGVEGVLKTPERRVFGSPGVYSVSKRPAMQNTSDGAISTFFHALLNKKSGQAALAAANKQDNIEQEKSDNCAPETLKKLESLDEKKEVEGMTILPNLDKNVKSQESVEA